MTTSPPPPPPSLKILKAHSPTLTKLLKARPAPIRETALISAATSRTKPIKPAAGDCCGSSCDPCVMELFAQELKVWKECALLREVVGAEEGGDGDVKEEEEEDKEKLENCKVPGAFEW